MQAERRLEEAEQKLAALTAASSSGAAQLQLLTPRPTEWGEAQQLAAECKVSFQLNYYFMVTLHTIARLPSASRPTGLGR